MRTKKHVYVYFAILSFMLIFTGYMIGKSLISSQSITVLSKHFNIKQGHKGPETDPTIVDNEHNSDGHINPGTPINSDNMTGTEHSDPIEPATPPSTDGELDPALGTESGAHDETETHPQQESPDDSPEQAHPDPTGTEGDPLDQETAPATPLPPSTTVMRFLPGHSDTNKTVALTFDDGPDSKYTEQILEILANYDIKATFFLVGIQIERFPEMVERIANEGHDIGNHSWSHRSFSQLNEKAIVEEIRKTNELIESITGQSTHLFRAPYGDTSGSVMTYLVEEGQHTIGWSVDTKDWNGTSTDEILEILTKQLRPGGIVLQHSFGGKDGDLSNTIEALPLIIEYLIEHDYRFMTVTEALNLAAKV